MVYHFVTDSHEVMTALIVVLPLIVVVEISLQLHQSLSIVNYLFFNFFVKTKILITIWTKVDLGVTKESKRTNIKSTLIII
jgi:hypothetical protein